MLYPPQAILSRIPVIIRFAAVLLALSVIAGPPAPAQAQDDSGLLHQYSFVFGGKLGAEGVLEGATSSYTVRLGEKPPGRVRVKIENQNLGRAAVQKDKLVFTAKNWKRPRRVEVTGMVEGSVTLTHTVKGAEAGQMGANTLEFDVEAVLGQACTYENVHRYVLRKALGEVYTPGALDPACELVEVNVDGTAYTRYTYPFEAFIWVEYSHYSHVSLYVDAEDRIVGVFLKKRDAWKAHRLDLPVQPGQPEHPGYSSVVMGIGLGLPGEDGTVLGYLPLEKSACGFDGLVYFVELLRGETSSSGLGGQRGCIDRERTGNQRVAFRTPVVLNVEHEGESYRLLAEGFSLGGVSVRYYLASAAEVAELNRQVKWNPYDNAEFLGLAGMAGDGVAVAAHLTKGQDASGAWISAAVGVGSKADHIDFLERHDGWYPVPE